MVELPSSTGLDHVHILATLAEPYLRALVSACANVPGARNHAAFWDGTTLRLTPAYDLCPQPGSGGEAAQAMAIGQDGERRSQLRVCRQAAATYQLSTKAAADIIEHQVTVINEQWDDAADQAHLTVAEKKLLWHRQTLNPFIYYDE